MSIRISAVLAFAVATVPSQYAGLGQGWHTHRGNGNTTALDNVGIGISTNPHSDRARAGQCPRSSFTPIGSPIGPAISL